jgi:hypothetical protein
MTNDDQTRHSPGHRAEEARDHDRRDPPSTRSVLICPNVQAPHRASAPEQRQHQPQQLGLSSLTRRVLKAFHCYARFKIASILANVPISSILFL